MQESKKKIRILEDNTLHLKREVQKLESENVRIQRRIEQLLRLSEGGRAVSIPADVRRDIEKGILVRQLKNHINTLRDLVAEKEQEIDVIKRDLKYNNLFELQREKDEYFKETQRLQTLVRDMKGELQKEKQRREWNNRLFGENGGDDLKKEVARLASGYQNILSNISFRHGNQLPNPAPAAHTPSNDSVKRPQSANSYTHPTTNSNTLFHKAPALGFRSPVYDDPIDNFGTSLLPHVSSASEEPPVFENDKQDRKPANSHIKSEKSIDSLLDASKSDAASKVTTPATVFNTGDKVEGKFRDGNDWYAAAIKAVNYSDGTYHIVYDDGDEEKSVPMARIRKRTDMLSAKASPSAPEKPPTLPQQLSPKVRQDRANNINSTTNTQQQQQPSITTTPQPEANKAKFKVGDKVNALYYNGSTAYPAVITAIIPVENGFAYDLLYDDGDREKKVAEPKITSREAETKTTEKVLPSLTLPPSEVASSKVETVSESKKKPVAKFLKDIKVEGLYDGGPTWYGATVQAVHASADGTTFTYDLLYDDGDKEEGVVEEEVRAIASPRGGNARSTVLSPSGLDKVAAKAFLTAQDWPKGLQSSFLENLESISLRYFICDDSSSMNTEDGTMLLKVGKKYKSVDCSRWSEIGECLKFHINLSRQALARSQFRFCNSGSPVMIGDHKGNANLKKAEEAGYQSLLQRLNGHADGTTPLCKQVNEVIEDIRAKEEQLRRDGKLAVVIISSDGEATDGDVMRSLQPLSSLPVNLVIRLCTGDQKVIDYWSGLETFKFTFDILDDIAREAEEVFRVNPWLTYAEPLHRIREFGVPHDLIDQLDNGLLSLPHLRMICHLIYGGEDMPDPVNDWSAFVARVKAENRKNPLVWNPLTQQMTEWIDATALETCYSKEKHLSSSTVLLKKKTTTTATPMETTRSGSQEEDLVENKIILEAVPASPDRTGSTKSAAVTNSGIAGQNSKHNDSMGSAIKSTNLDNFLDQLSDDDEDNDNGDTFGVVGLSLDGGKMVTLKSGEEVVISNQEDGNSDHDVEGKTYEEDFD